MKRIWSVLLFLLLVTSLSFADFELVDQNGIVTFLHNTSTGNLLLPTYNVSGNGTAGVGIDNASVNATGYLFVNLTNGSTQGPWNVTGPKGDTGATGPSTIVQGTACVKSPWANNTTTTQAHGLGVVPDFLNCYYTMINTDATWTAGTIIKANEIVDTGTSPGYMVSANTTNITIRTFNCPRVCNNTNMAEVNWAPANFNLTCVPYDFQP